MVHFSTLTVACTLFIAASSVLAAPMKADHRKTSCHRDASHYKSGHSFMDEDEVFDYRDELTKRNNYAGASRNYWGTASSPHVSHDSYYHWYDDECDNDSDFDDEFTKRDTTQEQAAISPLLSKRNNDAGLVAANRVAQVGTIDHVDIINGNLDKHYNTGDRAVGGTASFPHVSHDHTSCDSDHANNIHHPDHGDHYYHDDDDNDYFEDLEDEFTKRSEQV